MKILSDKIYNYSDKSGLWGAVKLTKARFTFINMIAVIFLISAGYVNYANAQDRKTQFQPEITFEFSGNDSFTDEVISSVCQNELNRLKQSARFSSDLSYVIVKEYIADDAAFKIKRLYLQTGFQFAEISYNFENIKDGMKIVFTIVEHNKIVVSEINIIGNTEFSKDYIQRILFNVKSAQLNKGRLTFIEKFFHQGIQQLEDLYIEAGYFDFAVRTLEIKYEPEPPAANSVIITLIVNEGLKYNITGFKPVGKTANLTEVVRRELNQYIGGQLNSKTRLLITNTILDIYKSKGYWNCKVDLKASNNVENGHVEVTIEIDSGKIYRLNDFFFNKTKSVKQSFLKSLLSLKSGDVYDIEKERESIRKLLRTNLLTDIEFKYFPVGDDLLDCNIIVKESWLSEIKAVVGYGSYEHFRSYLLLADNNVFGIGRRIAAKFGASQKSLFVEGEFKDPWTLGLTNTSLYFTPFFQRRIEPGFTLQEFGFSSKIEYLLSNKITLAAEYEMKESEAYDIKNVYLEGFESGELHAFLGSIRGYFLYDDRDSILNPTEGMRNIFRLELFARAFGGSSDFLKFSTINSYYTSFGDSKKIILAFKLVSSFLIKIKGLVPYQERLFNGGEASVRCFFEQGMNAGDNEESRAGYIKNVASVEMRLPLIWEWGLDAAAFIDIGNLSEKSENYFSNWEFALGVGLRYLTPFGVLRLDIAINADYFKDPSIWAFHLSLGYPF